MELELARQRLEEEIRQQEHKIRREERTDEIAGMKKNAYVISEMRKRFPQFADIIEASIKMGIEMGIEEYLED